MYIVSVSISVHYFDVYLCIKYIVISQITN